MKYVAPVSALPRKVLREARTIIDYINRSHLEELTPEKVEGHLNRVYQKYYASVSITRLDSRYLILNQAEFLGILYFNSILEKRGGGHGRQ